MDWHTQIWLDPLVAAGLLVPLGISVRWTWRRLLRPLAHMLTDWHGSPPRPGVPERPGVMVRLEQHDEALARIWTELSPNHGNSVKDQVTKLARQMGADE